MQVRELEHKTNKLNEIFSSSFLFSYFHFVSNCKPFKKFPIDSLFLRLHTHNTHIKVFLDKKCDERKFFFLTCGLLGEVAALFTNEKQESKKVTHQTLRQSVFAVTR